MLSVLREYDTRIDVKKRLTIRGSEYEYYHVKEYEDGHIELLPRVLVDPSSISVKTLESMDNAVKNLNAGKASSPIDLSIYADFESGRMPEQRS